MNDLSFNPATKPPDDDRVVVVRMKHGGVEMGYFRKGKWQLVTGRSVAVTSWSERPNYTPKQS